MVDKASEKTPLSQQPPSNLLSSENTENASPNTTGSRIGNIALQRLKSAQHPSPSIEGGEAKVNLHDAKAAKAEAKRALQAFVKQHNHAAMSTRDKQEYARLEWEAAKCKTVLKETQLNCLSIVVGPNPGDAEEASNILEALVNANRELLQAKMEEASAKTYFFSQKVEVARESLANIDEPGPKALPQEHLKYLSLRAIYVSAMSQHMAAYLEEVEIKYDDAQEIVKGLESQGDISSEIYIQARRYLKEADEDWIDAKQAHANVLATVAMDKLKRKE